MKKKLFLVMVIALSLCLLFCACKGIDNEIEIKFPQSFDPSDATDLDAVELYNEALENLTAVAQIPFNINITIDQNA